ncbi:MAG: hypothetical protein RLZZ324_354 [Candidatus Parcubacteria bacterium]|jgi:hypothetical protein
MTNELQSFVKEALGKGLPRTDIRKALLDAKWEEQEVDGALALYAEVPFAIPVPRRKPYLSAREAFMYLVLFMTLYISAFNLGSLLFDFINRAFPDATQGNYYDPSTLRFAVASLIVAFPLYLWLSSLMQRAITRDPEKKTSKIRGWLTYLTLFVTAGIIIGDVIALLFNLLGGELTARFLLKVLVVGFIAGMIFGYYLWDSRKSEKSA